MILTSVIITPPSITTTPNYFVLVEGAKVKSYYEILQLKNDATLQDVKKAYRRLAVLHHPDRNIGNEEEATIKFREISEAYEVLSDEESRRQYDQSLKGGAGSHHFGSFGGSGGGGGKWSHERRNARHYRDPFAQFNDVFKNDPFFAEAFKSLDDLFDKHFAGQEGTSARNQNRNKKDVEKNSEDDGGLLWNIAKNWLPNIQVTTSSSTTFGGQTTYSSTSRTFGGGSSTSSSSSQYSSHSRGSGSSSSSSTYTSRSTRTIIQNGQRVTIQSLEKDGNKIEEKYIGDQLIERKINGRTEDIGRIAGVGREF